MRIFVASAPKTGNTWLTLLLSTIYDLAPISLPFPFDRDAATRMGSNWIALQHYRPEPDLLSWAEQQNAIFVTPLRHPGDLLISLWHMLRNESYDPKADLRYLDPVIQDGAQMGQGTARYVRERYRYELHNMIRWIESGRSIILRYEDLWRDPVQTLTELTGRIHPVSTDRIETAIDLCDMNLLRKLRNDPEGKFFRKGGPGSWRDELPSEIVEIFRQEEPYPEYFGALGYTLDPHDPLIDAPAKTRVSTNPFVDTAEFDNGIQVPTIAVKLFLQLAPDLRAKWYNTATSTSSGSFYAWLNSPAADPRNLQHVAPVTNLAYYIYTSRNGLQAAFPDLFGTDRSRYLDWFVHHARQEYDLAGALVAPRQDISGGFDGGLASLETMMTPHHSVDALGRPPALSEAHARARINPHIPIAWPSWPKGLRHKMTALVQKVVRRSLKWYIDPIVEQQNRFNTATVQALDEAWAEIVVMKQQFPENEQNNLEDVDMTRKTDDS